MPLTITQEEMLAILEQAARDGRDELQPLLDRTVRSHPNYDEFNRRLARRLVLDLHQHGYVWARQPTAGDDLYKLLVYAIDAASTVSRVSLTSDDPSIALMGRQDIVQEIQLFQRRAKLAIVRRYRRVSEE